MYEYMLCMHDDCKMALYDFDSKNCAWAKGNEKVCS